MKNSKKIAIFGLLLAGALGVVGAVSAHGPFRGGDVDPEKREERMKHRMEAVAEVLDITVEELEQYKEDGVKLHEILEEKGIEKEDFHDQMMEQRKERMREHLEEMLDNGDITQEQYDQRLEWLENNNGHHRGFFHRGKGFRKGNMQAPQQEQA